MAQSKPRPGPWELYPVTGKSGKNKLALRAYAGRHICDISIYDDEDAADARLIAAAPELLAALKLLSAEEWRDDDDPILISAREQARAAIAKAEGGAS